MNVIDKLIDPVSTILDKFVADKDLKQKLEHELKTELHRANMAQIELNKVEAGHRSIFVAGWRPFLGWGLSFAMAYHFILQPIAVFAISIAGLSYNLPEFDMSSLMTVLLGMLGLGGMRSYEKVKGLTK